MHALSFSRLAATAWGRLRPWRLRLNSSDGALGLCKIPTANLQMRFVSSLTPKLATFLSQWSLKKGDSFAEMKTEGSDPADGDRTTPPEPILE